MQRRSIYVLMAILVLVALAIVLGLAGSGAWGAGWGRGPLTVAEWSCHMARVDAVVDTWENIAYRARTDKDGRVVDGPFMCLVVDTDQKRIWVERDGETVATCEADLLPRLAWRLYRSTPEGLEPLPRLARFRVHGINTDQQPLEMICLVGARGRQEHLWFSLSPSRSFSDHGRGRWHEPITWKSSEADSEIQRYESIVVSDADYEEARTRFNPDALPAPPKTVVTENRAAWMRVQKALYQEIENQVSQAGLELTHLHVTRGPGYAAGSATLGARNAGWWNRHRNGTVSTEVYLQIDYLGDEAWYAASAPDPHGRPSGRRSLDLEFLVSATGKIPDGNQEMLLAEGRQRQQVTPATHKWQATLGNGVTVEFIGVCENPSGGKSWWGPDGRPLGFEPCVNYQRHVSRHQDCTIYEMAWRIHRPRGRTSVRYGRDEFRESFEHAILDRYGNQILDGLDGRACALDASKKKTMVRIGASVDDGPLMWIAFKNISLVPGEDMGFEIVQGADAAQE